ncbi:carboxymuconolactone decarboxylase family protein [Labedaea rhizosphaerae]|uniref:4-carboxymuconolactone decarboxylase n=1 Tax=Labedaea rhizosphaerae TaxID=598644 RepID=A0A4V3CZP7_LABRH|nr:carboxymuconolactone decarboxylase family protein [Labedaea rhizosphaerae]TDQ00551.1 4-carboxymuconolactone decarboxylase [Labedaea rhizosphaerae]
MTESMAARGDRIRREVLGDEHVDRSNQNASPFSKPVQDLVTEYCWGVAWGDDTLDRKTRSLLNIVMMVALNRRHELELHTKGALRNGVSPEEIQAALIQATIYCGVPAGMEGFRAAASVVDEEGR